MTQIPPIDLQWLFPEVDIDALDIHKHQDFLLTRILERGRLVDVRWALKTYGDSEILAFFRRCQSNDLTARTKSFWRAYFDAEGEEWASPPDFRHVTRWPS